MTDSMTDKLNALKSSEPDSNDSATPDQPTEERMFQQYTSNRVATCLITTSGKRVNFTNHEYYTKDQDIIDYLDNEIKEGLKGFTKGVVVTAEEVNPKAAERRRIIEEFKASQEGRDFSAANTSKEEKAAKASILSTTGVTTHE